MKLVMENTNQVRAFAKRSLGVIVLVLMNTSYFSQAIAQNINFVNIPLRSSNRSLRQVPTPSLTKPQKRSGRVSFIQPKLPSNGAPSGRQRGAAGRGNCLHNVSIPLTAIVPSIKESIKNGSSAIVATNVWGLTVKERPTFLFYVPYTQASATGEFVLQDADDNDLYRALVTLPKEHGIIRLQLPPESAPLAIDKMYHWYFKVRCSQNMTSPVFVEGWVQRIALSPTFANQIENAASLQHQAALYAENGIWYDTAATLAQMRVQNLKDMTSSADWQDLLQTIDLSTLASQSIKRIDSKDEKSLISKYKY